jgi:hypothetical protein
MPLNKPSPHIDVQELLAFQGDIHPSHEQLTLQGYVKQVDEQPS